MRHAHCDTESVRSRLRELPVTSRATTVKIRIRRPCEGPFSEISFSFLSSLPARSMTHSLIAPANEKGAKIVSITNLASEREQGRREVRNCFLEEEMATWTSPRTLESGLSG